MAETSHSADFMIFDLALKLDQIKSKMKLYSRIYPQFLSMHQYRYPQDYK